MSSEKTAVSRKVVDDVLVAGIRFLGQHEEIAAYFDQLRGAVEPHIVGPPICLYHRAEDEGPTEARNIEVCYPVSRAVEAGEVRSRILKGGEVLCTSSVIPADAPWGPSDRWDGLIGYIREHQVSISEDPIREIRPGSEGDAAEQVLELQVSLHHPKWMGSLAEGLDRWAGDSVRRQVMVGSEGIDPDSPIEDRLQWTQEAMERLDAAVDDEVVRCTIMCGCAHRFPRGRIEKMRAEYERLGDLDALLEIMRADRSLGELSWYETLVREGNVIYATKDPVYPEKHREAVGADEKRAYYCHCAIGRAAIRSKAPLSPTFCGCGAGWYVPLWEGIVGGPVKVEVLESVVKGDDRCRFAIHLPVAE